MHYDQFLFIIIVFLLGLRHGVDPDHLATINSIAKNASLRLQRSKLVGVYFALGHGLVVILISVLVGLGVQHAVPQWLDSFGNFVSAFFLLLFGAFNLYNLAKTKPGQNVEIAGFKSILFRKIVQQINHPILVIVVGILFALSFDTFSQAALFSLSATAMLGWVFSGILGVVFTLGMMMSDGLNGWIVTKLIQKADKLSKIASYLVSLIIIASSMVVGTLSALKLILN